MLPTPRPSVVFQRLPDGAVLFAPEAEIYFGLNEVGAAIWTLLSPAAASLDDLCRHLGDRYPDVPLEQIRADVRELLDHLVREGLADAPPADTDDAPQAA